MARCIQSVQLSEYKLKLKHKKPCKECPWRLEAPKGWLGGQSPEMYADAVDNNEVPACHLKDFGPDSDKTAMCVGALSTMANQCKAAHNTKGGEKARQTVGRNMLCFLHVAAFYKHHTNKVYLTPMLRENN